jgi:hypothetical protein
MELQNSQDWLEKNSQIEEKTEKKINLSKYSKYWAIYFNREAP